MMTANEIALEMIANFEKKPNPSAYFTKLDRQAIADGLKDRVKNPDLIQQGSKSSLCGPTALVVTLARTRITEYVKAVTGLYDFGTVRIGAMMGSERNLIPGRNAGWLISPRKDLLNYKPSSAIAEVDWIILASIRDSENWALHYNDENNQASAITRGATLASWMRNVGYTEVIEKTNNFFCKSATELQEAGRLYLDDYHVCLLIDANALYDGKTPDYYPNHWVILLSYIDYAPFVGMDVLSWGERWKLPKSQMKLDEFLNYFYGYIAVKY